MFILFSVSDKCSFFGTYSEVSYHLFFNCSTVRAFWNRFTVWWSVSLTSKCIWNEITFSIFWKFNNSKTLFQSLTRAWKKLAILWHLKIVRICSQKWSSNHAAKMSWWRRVVDKTTRLQYATACIGYTQRQYPCRHLKIQRKYSISSESLDMLFCHRNPSYWLILSTSLRHKMILTIFRQKLSSFSAKHMTKFLLRRTLTFTIDLFTCWTVKLCKEKNHIICTSKDIIIGLLHRTDVLNYLITPGKITIFWRVEKIRSLQTLDYYFCTRSMLNRKLKKIIAIKNRKLRDFYNRWEFLL